MTTKEMGYSVWYYSNETLGSIKECEVSGVDFATATKWFKHHTTNVTANLGLTVRVIITDADDCIVAEWKHGLGIVWPEHEEDKPMVEETEPAEDLVWHLVHPKADLGYLPSFLSVADPRPAKEQLNANYKFGGWRPFKGFKLRMADFALLYAGDPPTMALAWTLLRDERVVLYVHDWVAVIQPDGSFEVCRMD